MSVRIRLARHGKKNYAFFHIVVTDSRSPRDGRYIEKIGTYDPNTNPASIVLDSEKALKWLSNGAQPSDTCRRILSYEGVLLRKHLNGGVAKGAISQDVADQKWNAWKAERDAKVESKKKGLATKADEQRRTSAAAEAKVNQERAEAIAKRKAEEEEAARKAREAEEAAAREAAAEAEAAPVVEAAEAPAEEPAAEVSAEA